MVTIYKDIYSKEPFYVTISESLARIKNGKSKERIEQVRATTDKDEANKIKSYLPSVCFSGKFDSTRKDAGLIEHSGFICLDFDHIENVQEKKAELSLLPFCYAVWVSPSGNGIKMLVRIADGNQHRAHFASLKDLMPEIDKSGVNESRVTYESYDPEIIINENAEIYTKTLKTERVEVKVTVDDQAKILDNLFKWITNKGDAFVSGERNHFIFKFASACCRFGVHEENTLNYCTTFVLTSDNTFSVSECQRTVSSAYRANKQAFGTVEFEKDQLVEKTSRNEVSVKNINPDIYDPEIRPKDIIFGEDVKERAFRIFDNGYEGVESTGVHELDYYFKFKRGEITLLSGIGNYGKSSLLKYLLLMKAIKYNQKFALFTPEDNPAEEFYHDLVEIYLGKDCTPNNHNKPTREEYEKAYDWISKRIFYIYPEQLSPTPEYIKERFLELIIKEKVDGCVIDPFNQLTNNYGSRSDKYLETLLSDFGRFAQLNGVYFVIVAHPTKLQKPKNDENYPCPDVFDIADGAMWNNKMDNILIYHRPSHQTDPNSSVCELHTKKIRRQKTVGKKGTLIFDLNRTTRRFVFAGRDYMAELLSQSPAPMPKQESDFRKISRSRVEEDEKQYPF